VADMGDRRWLVGLGSGGSGWAWLACGRGGKMDVFSPIC